MNIYIVSYLFTLPTIANNNNKIKIPNRWTKFKGKKK